MKVKVKVARSQARSKVRSRQGLKSEAGEVDQVLSSAVVLQIGVQFRV